MKHFKLILLIFLGLFLLPEAKAQTDPSTTQTICFGSVKNYRVDWNGTDPITGTPGSSYVWSVTTPGFTGSITPTSLSGNSVSVNWGTTPGAVPSGTTYTLQVVETNAGCPAPAITMNVTVIPLPTVIVGANQSICQNTISASLGGVIGGSASGASWTSDVAGGTFSPNATTLNATWTPPAGYTGTANLTLTTTGMAPCIAASASVQVNITSVNSIALSSAVGTNSQTVCVNNAITNITYSVTGAAGATFSGLPAGVVGNFSAGVVTISGTPTTAVNSPFNYTITLTGGCGTVTATGSITVTPNGTISLTSLAGTDNQTVCNNTAITNITYSTAGATGATIAGLPTGVTGNYSAGVVTISGTPSSTLGSPFTYTITLTGGCGTITETGTITVTPIGTISLTSAAGTINQTICNNTAITNITYTTSGATGATFSGLPTGVSGNYSAGVVTISGTPSTTAGSPFTYTITLTGGCGTVTATGIITVNPIPTIVADTPVCSADFSTWSVDVTVSDGLVTSTVGTVVNTSGNNWTISGIPIATTSITLTSTALGCPGTLSVTAPNCTCPTITAPIAANASYCIGSPIPALTVTNGPAAGFTLNWYDQAIGGLLIGTGTPFTPTAAGIYYAEFVENATSCKSQRTAVTVTENALPNVAASVSTTICEGANTVLTASNAATYAWSPATGLSATTGTPVTASPTSTQTYTVTGTDSNGCVNTATVTVTVTPTPTTSPIFHD